MASKLDFDAVAFFHSELTDVRLDVRVAAMQNVVILATAIGAHETKTRLLPLLCQILIDAPEEALVALARRLADIVRLTSDDDTLDPNVVTIFLSCVAELGSFTSTYIRNALRFAFKQFLTFYRGDLDPLFALVVNTLGLSTHPSQRELCCSLIGPFYAYLARLMAERDAPRDGAGGQGAQEPQAQQGPQLSQAAQAERYISPLSSFFSGLILDPDSTVRRIAGEQLKCFLESTLESGVCDKHICTPSFFFQTYDKLSYDSIDSVRASNVENGILLLRLIVQIKDQASSGSGATARDLRDVKEILPLLIKSISRGTSDRYWLVRKYTAEAMPTFFEQIHKKLDTGDCAVMFKLLTDDVEPEIRSLTIGLASSIVQYLDGPTLQQIFLPALIPRAADPDVGVRCSVADHAVHELAQALAACNLPKDTLANLYAMIVEICKQLMADASFEVRSHAVVSIVEAYIDQSLHPGLRSYCLSVIEDCAAKPDDQWRAREALLVSLTKAINFAPDSVRPLVENNLCGWLTDSVYSVRMQVCDVISLSAMTYGPAWFLAKLLPPILTIIRASGNSYQNRKACGYALIYSVEAFLGSEEPLDCKQMISAITALGGDKTHYVRLAVAKAAHKVVATAETSGTGLPPDLQATVRELLKKLSQDDDPDVMDEAQKAYDKLKALGW